MSWLVEVPKTIQYIVDHPKEPLIFMRSYMKYVKGSVVYAIESKDVETLTFNAIKNCINDPEYILIKIDKKENDNEADN